MKCGERLNDINRSTQENKLVKIQPRISYIFCYKIVLMFYNGFGLGEVAFVRWLVCRKAILPNPCYTLFVLIFCAVGINH
jgi:hypothetical protein